MQLDVAIISSEIGLGKNTICKFDSCDSESYKMLVLMSILYERNETMHFKNLIQSTSNLLFYELQYFFQIRSFSWKMFAE